MSPLVVPGERSLAAEFPPETHARLVLEAIGSGARSFADIGRRAGIPQTSLNRALEILQQKGVVARETPYSAARNPRSPRYLVSDEYLRFWLRFVGPGLELIQRGRGDLVNERLRRAWPEYRGGAIEPLVRRSIARMLPDERFGRTLFVGGYWTRDGRVEVDLVGGRGERQTDAVHFLGSIKWRESAAFGREDAARLAAMRAAVPGTTPSTRLVGVSRSGFRSAGVDIEIEPEELLGAWRRRS
jgi:DNA-binding Lrp family transcriptional regulator